MKRRKFVTLLGATVVAWPLSTRAQEAKKIPKIGVLWHAGNAEEEGVFYASLLQGFRDLGYVEGRTLVFEHTFAAEQYERFNENAAALVARNVDVLVAVTRSAAIAAKRATATIPIVFTVVPDPVGLRLVESLGHPGGNITGLTNIATDLGAKRIELLKEAFPALTRIALLVNASDPIVRHRNIDEAQKVAKQLNIAVEPIDVRSPQDFVAAFARIEQVRLEAVVTGVDPMIYNERKHLSELALARRLPTMVHVAQMVEDGNLMSYALSLTAMFHRTAAYVDRILKGAKPADLPVEQPTKFDLVINLKTAKDLGLTIPPSLLARADEVIE
jgi:putative tryptophan/tyrosine transport system substrate-binding protein